MKDYASKAWLINKPLNRANKVVDSLLLAYVVAVLVQFYSTYGV